MRTAAVVQGLIFLVIAVGLLWVVVYVSDGWADWVVFGGIVLAVAGVIVAYHHREYPYATQKRSFTRDPDSRW